MFKSEVATLPLTQEVTGFQFFTQENGILTPVPPTTTVGDLFIMMDDTKIQNETERQYFPDFALMGLADFPKSGHNNTFYISERSKSHIIYVTGVIKDPKATKDFLDKNFMDRSKFRIQGAPVVYYSYWEDLHRGYLFQVVENKINELLKH